MASNTGNAQPEYQHIPGVFTAPGDSQPYRPSLPPHPGVVTRAQAARLGSQGGGAPLNVEDLGEESSPDDELPANNRPALDRLPMPPPTTRYTQRTTAAAQGDVGTSGVPPVATANSQAAAISYRLGLLLQIQELYGALEALGPDHLAGLPPLPPLPRPRVPLQPCGNPHIVAGNALLDDGEIPRDLEEEVTSDRARNLGPRSGSRAVGQVQGLNPVPP